MKNLISSLLFLTVLPQSFAQEPKPAPEPKKELTLEHLNQLMRFIIRGPIKKAQTTGTKVAIRQLEVAISDYYEEYQQLPLGSETNADATQITSGKKGIPLMAALLGLKSAEEENYKLISFFDYKAAKEKKDGILRTEKTAELFDPWGSPYHLLLDYDYDSQLKDPISKNIVHNRKALIWSNGPDGKSGSDETNKDNILKVISRDSQIAYSDAYFALTRK